MKYLPFELRYALEAMPCERCSGSGRWGVGLRQCHNCRGLGRKVTLAGRELFYAIADLLGKPVVTRESRIPVKHFERILGQQLRVGMRVARLRYTRAPAFSDIAEAVPFAGGMRLRLADGSVMVAGSIETFDRALTDAEIARAEALMVEHAGRGAVERVGERGGNEHTGA